MSLDTFDSCVALFGLNDQNIRTLEEELVVSVFLRDGELQIIGDNEKIKTAEQVIAEMLRLIEAGEHLDSNKIRYLIHMARQGTLSEVRDSMGEVVAYTYKGKKIKCKTAGQRTYVSAVRNSGLTFSVGPAGTGKTYLAMAKAVDALARKQVSRIILTRPAVEAGENLGFLPGTLSDKIDPYLRPLYDALHDMLAPEALSKLLAAGTIEVAPLAYMRGRTLNDAFVILDEAQNTSPEQMKMFLTRLGFGSTMVVTGDTSQVDLPGSRPSGLVVVRRILSDVDGIAFCELTSRDVVRHRLVGRIIDAYSRYDAERAAGQAHRPRDRTTTGGREGATGPTTRERSRP